MLHRRGQFYKIKFAQTQCRSSMSHILLLCLITSIILYQLFSLYSLPAVLHMGILKCPICYRDKSNLFQPIFILNYTKDPLQNAQFQNYWLN